MKLEEQLKDNIPPESYLIGLLSSFNNSFQATADLIYKEITWKQFFAIVCISICKEAPTLGEVSKLMGSSHQNVKQILLKLEKKDFIKFVTDDIDKRKQRILLTDKCIKFSNDNNVEALKKMAILYKNIDKKDLLTTIRVISQMRNNLIEM